MIITGFFSKNKHFNRTFMAGATGGGGEQGICWGACWWQLVYKL